MLLIVIADLNVGSQGEGSGIRGDDLIQDLKQGSLAGPVVSDDGDVLPAAKLEINIPEQYLVGKCFA